MNNSASTSVQRTYSNARRGASECSAGALNYAHAAVGRTDYPANVTTHYCYDHVGNMVGRQTGSVVETLLYDMENRLTHHWDGGALNATFAYDGDGSRVRATINGDTTLYAEGIEYEPGTGEFTTHYAAEGQRIAVRKGAWFHFLLNDHLSSTSVILKSNGTLWGELRYSAWGETRHTFGNIPTDRQFTGQINDGATGLYYYNARYYDPALHRFVQADTNTQMNRSTGLWSSPVRRCASEVQNTCERNCFQLG